MDEIEFKTEDFETMQDFGVARKDYRHSKVKSYLLFCKKIKNNEMDIVRILHKKWM